MNPIELCDFPFSSPLPPKVYYENILQYLPRSLVLLIISAPPKSKYVFIHPKITC